MSDEEPPDQLRSRAVRALQLYFVRNRWPRLYMSAIVLITGAAGFVASWAMLHGGVTQMWLRYPVALAIAYAVFLLLVRVWAELERGRFDEEAALAEVLEERRQIRKSDRSGRIPDRPAELGDWINLTDFSWDADEGCLVGLAIAVLLTVLAAVLAAVFSIISVAPVLVAEVFLDAVLSAALYRRLRRLDRQAWFWSAIRRTYAPVLITAVSLFAAGLIMQSLVPGAKSVGGVWRHYHPASAPFDGDETLLEKE